MFKYNIAILGAGFIAEKHLEVLSNNPKVNLELIISRTLKKPKKLAKKFNIKNVSKNIDEISKYKIHGIFILVSDYNIFNVSRKLLKLKIPLFIEKPPGINYQQTKKLIEINRKFNTLTMVGYNRRFYSIFEKGKKIIKSKGKLLGISIEGHERFWRVSKNLYNKSKKNWIYANSTHTIDLIRYFGDDILKLKKFSKKLVESSGDQFQLIFESKKGIIGNYYSHWYSPGGWSVKLFGEMVTVIFDPLEKGRVIDKNLKEKNIIPEKYDIKYKQGFYKQANCFINMIKNKKLAYPGQSLEDTIKTMNIAKKIIS